MDKREDILLRLIAILEQVAQSTGESVYRDRAELEDSDLPAFVLLDGNEQTVTRSTDRRGPQVMLLLPQIFYVPVPPENKKNEGIGPRLSDYRVTLIKAIMSDGPLADLLGANGYIEYRGMETDMNTGAEVQGQFKLDFALAYVLNFSKL